MDFIPLSGFNSKNIKKHQSLTENSRKEYRKYNSLNMSSKRIITMDDKANNAKELGKRSPFESKLKERIRHYLKVNQKVSYYFEHYTILSASYY